MTREVMRRLIKEAYSMTEAEEAIGAEIATRIDYATIAELIVDQYEDELAELVASIIAEEILLF